MSLLSLQSDLLRGIFELTRYFLEDDSNALGKMAVYYSYIIQI